MTTSLEILCVSHRLVVNPERKPGDNHDHHGGQVDRDDVEGYLPGKQQVNLTNIASIMLCIMIIWGPL